MTLKHTPGPWKRGIFSDTAGDVAYVWPESDGLILARVQSGNVTANSLLISAAPDLLAALQYVTDMLSSSIAPDDYEPFRKCVSQARAAISKATGE